MFNYPGDRDRQASCASQLTSLTACAYSCGSGTAKKSMLLQGAGWHTQPCLQSAKVRKVNPTSDDISVACGATIPAMDKSQWRFRSDLAWFVSEWNGVTFLHPPTHLPQLEITSDASGT